MHSSNSTQNRGKGFRRRDFLGKLASIVGSSMVELGRQRAAAAAGAGGRAGVYQVEKKLAQLDSGTVLEPYTGEDLKETLKAAEVPHLSVILRSC